MNSPSARFGWAGATAAMVLLVAMQALHTPFHHLPGAASCCSPNARTSSSVPVHRCSCPFEHARRSVGDSTCELKGACELEGKHQTADDRGGPAKPPSPDRPAPCDGSHGDCHLCRFLAQGYASVVATPPVVGVELVTAHKPSADPQAILSRIAIPAPRGPPIGV